MAHAQMRSGQGRSSSSFGLSRLKRRATVRLPDAVRAWRRPGRKARSTTAKTRRPARFSGLRWPAFSAPSGSRSPWDGGRIDQRRGADRGDWGDRARRLRDRDRQRRLAGSAHRLHCTANSGRPPLRVHLELDFALAARDLERPPRLKVSGSMRAPRGISRQHLANLNTL